MNYTIRDFHLADQQAVFNLVNTGLSTRFDDPKPEYNPDLFDIEANYVEQGASFLLFEDGADLIGCGALIKEHGSDEIARIVRVSVRLDLHGRGIGRMISECLLDRARERGFSKVLVETNSDWANALHLYKSCGFIETHREKSPDFDFTEVHMELDLHPG